MASTFGSTSWKEHVGVHPPLLASSPSQVFLSKDLVWKNITQDLWVDGGGDFIQREVIQALPNNTSVTLGDTQLQILVTRRESHGSLFSITCGPFQ